MGDPPRLYLHIGAGKCGSSAIQQFLDTNAEHLRKQGFLVPGRSLQDDASGCGQHLQFFEDGIGTEGFAELVSTRLDALGETVTREGLHSIVISGENLINPKGFVELFQGSADRFQLKVIAYVRRQDDFMISAWQQWQLKQFDTFWDYYARHRGRINWHRQLERWRQPFGSEAMIVRRYSSDALLDGDVVADFCRAIGADTVDLTLTGRANRSLHERFNTLANKHRDVLFESIHDHRFYTFLETLLGEKAYKDYSGSTLLTLAQRRLILEDHAEANERLRSTYFPDLDPDALFPRPTARDVHVTNERPMDEATELLYVAMFRMWLDQQG
ncbi:MAG: hypothetical protein OER95_04895 [Acidimicrobiia bacterium]|nr:hypothetical protein [Acidimicrobiia bacterium]